MAVKPGQRVAADPAPVLDDPATSVDESAFIGEPASPVISEKNEEDYAADGTVLEDPVANRDSEGNLVEEPAQNEPSEKGRKIAEEFGIDTATAEGYKGATLMTDPEGVVRISGATTDNWEPAQIEPNPQDVEAAEKRNATETVPEVISNEPFRTKNEDGTERTDTTTVDTTNVENGTAFGTPDTAGTDTVGTDGTYVVGEPAPADPTVVIEEPTR